MRKLMMQLNLAATMLVICLWSSAAQAQASRTWVSGVGDDANPCSRTAPCKTFAGAIPKTAPGGEIDANHPGDFGTLTIKKATTIDGGRRASRQHIGDWHQRHYRQRRTDRCHPSNRHQASPEA